MSAARERAAGPLDRLADALWRRPALLTAALLAPPLLWLGVLYLGALGTLLAHGFFSVDEFSGLIDRTPTLKTFGELLTPANLDILLRTAAMAAAVTLGSVVVAFPIAWMAARHARGRWKALFYLGIMLPLWASYLVKVYAWKLILAREGALAWALDRLGLTWALEAALATPVIGGPSLSVSHLGTFLVFLYVWSPFMILPIEAALARVPTSLLEASADLGASGWRTFRSVIWPLALPGVAAGSIFTFSLTLGDYIIPQIVGTSARYVGQAVYQHQGVAGNLPLAAAFATAPILIMLLYLRGARRLGAFDAL